MPCEIPQERGTHNLLCTKHFHGVPFASPHAYSLKSRYGKVTQKVSCQEAIRPPYTTFDNFFRCVPIGKPHPRFVISDASVSSLLWRRLVLRRTSHPSGSRLIDVSRSRQTSAPGTVRAPKTLGALPCPIGYIAQMSWLPRGSNFYRAHSRGVARLHNPVAGHLSRVETGTNQIQWMLTNFSPSLRPQPYFGPTSAKRFARIKRHKVSHDVVAGP